MSSRDEILGRIREALSVPSDPGVKALSADAIRDPRQARVFLPPGGNTPEERLKRFQELAAKLKVEVELFPDMDATRARLQSMCTDNGWATLASHHHVLTDALLRSPPLPLVWTEDEPGIDALGSASAGITACEALIAQTGSVLVTSKGCGGRSLSVLPPHHIVLATPDQLLPDMLAGYDILRERYGDTLPSFISFITGASRTGDIERILVLGAHGPKRLTVWIVGD